MYKLIVILCFFVFGCSPKTAEQYIKLGDKQKTCELSEQSYNEALKLDKLNLKAYNRIGMLYMYSRNTKELGKSRMFFKKTIEIEAKNIDALFGMGETYKTEAIRNDTVFTNIMDTAISYYSKVIMIDSNNISASYQRGYSYHYLGDSLNCYKDYKKACDLGDNLSCDIINKEHY